MVDQRYTFITCSNSTPEIPYHFPEGPAATKSSPMEFSSGGGGSSGGDPHDDLPDSHRGKKRYHRHTAHQIQRLESMFKECPHPDEKARNQLSRELSLHPRQIKFWFQNRRTQMKAQHERADNCSLRAENDKIRCENIAIREALKNVICPSCGSSPASDDSYFDEQKLRIENSHLKEELDRVSSIAAKYIGRPISQLPPVQPIHVSSLDLSMASFGGHGIQGPSLDLDLLHGSSSSVIPNLAFPPMSISDMDKSLMAAANAMDELIRLLQSNEPLWMKGGDGRGETLNLESYERVFQSPYSHMKNPSIRIEASRDSGVVIMNSLALVDMFMDAKKWVELYPTIVSRAKTTEANDVVFCGRIIMFLAHFFPLSERSAVNIKGVFNTSNETKYEKEAPESSSIDFNFYKTFWSLQVVLSTFEAQPLSDEEGNAINLEDEASNFSIKYLTSSNLDGSGGRKLDIKILSAQGKNDKDFPSDTMALRKVMDILASKSLLLEDNIVAMFYIELLHCLHLVLAEPRGYLTDHQAPISDFSQIRNQPPFLGLSFIARPYPKLSRISPSSSQKIHAMAKGKLILICQSGGEFIAKDDGTLSYVGAEANAVNINHETLFDDLKLKLAEMGNLDQKTISIKYYLPGNRRNLITLRNDKDLKRMIKYHVNSVTADIFVNGKEGFDHDAVKVHTRSEHMNDTCRDSGVKLAETVNHIPAPSADASLIVSNLKNLACHVTTSPDAAAAADKNAVSSSPGQTYTASPMSSEHGANHDSDYKPRLGANSDVDQRPVGLDMSGSPADTVKKRRRTASWIVGAHGPIIVAVSDNDVDRRKRKRNNQGGSSFAVIDDLDHSSEIAAVTNDLDNSSVAALPDDGLPEKLVASWKDCITGVGQDFISVKDFREALQKYAIAHRFVYKLKKNDSNRASGICVEEGCSWSIHASWVPASQSFRIKKFINSHTCGGESWKNAHPAKKLLVSVIKDKLRDSPHHKPKEIAKSISRDFGIQLKYTQVRRGIEGAREQLQGSYKESYNRLPWFCKKLVETNAGSFVKLETDDEKRLRRLFVSFLSCVESFQNVCRPILFLNATSLKSKYQESLLTATAVDADDGFFPVAFCIVDTENEDNWHWFLEQLKSAISTSLPLTFVSDWEKGLKKSVHEVFENANHGYSIYHLLESFKRNLRGPFHGEGRAVLPGKLLAAAHAVRLSGFKKITEEIRQISSNAYDWVMQIEPEHWTCLSFRGEQYNYIVQNVAEPYSKLMEEIRESTIMQKIEALIYMISQVIDSRQMESSAWATILTPSKEERIQEAVVEAHGLRVFISSDVLFEVHDDSTHVVDLQNWECTCLEWKPSGLPCRHATAALSCSGKSVYNFCSQYFTAESYRATYFKSINPIPGIGSPPAKEDGDSGEVKVLPPALRSPNVQKKEQSKADDPDRRTVTCSKCKEPGHNKASCKATL